MQTSFLPVIKNPLWINNPLHPEFVTQSIVNGIDSPELPSITFGIDQGDTVAYLQTDSYDDASVEVIIDNALLLLKQRTQNLEWSQVNQSKAGHTVHFLALSGDFYAAECILLEERLQEAHALLNAEHLFACTPQRGLLLVIADEPENAFALDIFVKVCEENYADTSAEAISPVLWQVKNGRAIKPRRLDAKLSGSGKLVVGGVADEVAANSGLRSKARLYLPLQILFMTLFGTAFAGFYGIAHNYKNLGNRNACRITVLVGALIGPFYLWAFLALPKWPYDRALPLLVAGLMAAAAYIAQNNALKYQLSRGAKKQTIPAQLLVIGSCMLIVLVVMAFYFYLF